MQKILTEWRKYLAEQKMSKATEEAPPQTMVPKPATAVSQKVPPERLIRMKAKAAGRRRCAQGWKGYRKECGGWSPSSKGHAAAPLISPEDILNPAGLAKTAAVKASAGAGLLVVKLISPLMRGGSAVVKPHVAAERMFKYGMGKMHELGPNTAHQGWRALINWVNEQGSQGAGKALYKPMEQYMETESAKRELAKRLEALAQSGHSVFLKARARRSW